MPGWNIQRVEIVKAGLDLGAVLYRITHRDKHSLNSLTNERDRMKMSLTWTAAGKRYVNLLALESQRLGVLGELLIEPRDFRFNLRAELVHLASELGSIFRLE